MHRHSTATLMGMTKKELVEYVRMAEHNQDVAEETLKQQAENVKDWFPVVHGEWVDRYARRYANPLYECSECKKPAPRKSVKSVLGNWQLEQELTDYCPHCGAKMDGDGNVI